jgi:hypothetical protein
MDEKKYIIKYTIELVDALPLTNKEIKISNCMNDLHAKIRLEKYLEKKYINFKKLIVHTCKEDYLNSFGNMFGNSNDFSNIFGNLFNKKGNI